MFNRVEILGNHIGLVYRKGFYVKLLQAGKHWLRKEDSVTIYDRTKPFGRHAHLALLLEDADFRAAVEVYEVTEQAVAMHYVDGVFVKVVGAGRYVEWLSSVKHEYISLDMSELEVPNVPQINTRTLMSLAAYMHLHKVEVYEQALLLIDGKLEKALAPGVYRYWKNKRALSVLKVDTRPQTLEVSGQELLTKDKAAVRINFFGVIQVLDIETALLKTKDYKAAIYLQLQMMLREYVGKLSLDDLLAKKESISDYLLSATAAKASTYGLVLKSVGIRDVILPGEIKEIMNRVLVAEKQAQAATIARREETAATRSLLNTAKLMEGNEMLWKLKEMEYVEKIADKINSISVSGSSQVIDQLRQIFIKEA